MKHIDLFSGIGGFALAVDTVWPRSEHIFCEIDPFCQQVLKKHWPNSKIYGDIRTLTNTSGTGTWVEKQNTSGQERQPTQTPQPKVVRQRNGEGYAEGSGTCADILTGGFPCQPFSQAGRRQGTSDDRYLWPEMFRVIREFHPTWVIAENVRGLVTWNEGMVLQQVCADLESEGYEVQPLIIPAVAVNAPHRRDRIWFIAHRKEQYSERTEPGGDRAGEPETKAGNRDSDVANPRQQHGEQGNEQGVETSTSEWTARATDSERQSEDATDSRRIGQEKQQQQAVRDQQYSWDDNWVEVAAELCGIYDGLPAELDGFKLTKSAHRRERLKSLGNAIVPQVAIEIMKAIHE